LNQANPADGSVKNMHGIEMNSSVQMPPLDAEIVGLDMKECLTGLTEQDLRTTDFKS
jgi:hypothetical protein